MLTEQLPIEQPNPFEEFIQNLEDSADKIESENPTADVRGFLNDVRAMELQDAFYASLFEARDNILRSQSISVESRPVNSFHLVNADNVDGKPVEFLEIEGLNNLTTQQFGMMLRKTSGRQVSNLVDQDKTPDESYIPAGSTVVVNRNNMKLLVHRSTYDAILKEFIRSDPEALKSADILPATAALGRGTLAISQDARHLQLELTSPESLWVVVTGEDKAEMNMALVQGSPRAAEDLSTTVDLLHQEGKPALVFIPKHSRELNQLAEKLGLTEPSPSPIMEYVVDNYSELAVVRKPELKLIKRVDSKDSLDHSLQIQSETLHLDYDAMQRTVGAKVLEDPNVVTLVGYLEHPESSGDDNLTPKPETINTIGDGTTEADLVPVTTATFVIDGDIGTVWSVGTIEKFQSKGLANEIMLEGMKQCIERGVKKFYLMSTKEGSRLYERIGFTTIQELQAWLLKVEE